MKPATRKKHTSAPRSIRQQDRASHRWISQIELLQMRVAAAEDAWKEAKEQFRQARRRRKLAKLFAKRAKKHARTAEGTLDLARKALADAKAQSATLSWRAAARKVSKAKKVRALAKKRPIAKRSSRKSPLAPDQAAAREPSSAVPTPAEGIPHPNPASLPPPTTPGQSPAAV